MVNKGLWIVRVFDTGERHLVYRGHVDRIPSVITYWSNIGNECFVPEGHYEKPKPMPDPDNYLELRRQCLDVYVLDKPSVYDGYPHRKLLGFELWATSDHVRPTALLSPFRGSKT